MLWNLELTKVCTWFLRTRSDSNRNYKSILIKKSKLLFNFKSHITQTSQSIIIERCVKKTGCTAPSIYCTPLHRLLCLFIHMMEQYFTFHSTFPGTTNRRSLNSLIRLFHSLVWFACHEYSIINCSSSTVSVNCYIEPCVERWCISDDWIVNEKIV